MGKSISRSLAFVTLFSLVCGSLAAAQPQYDSAFFARLQLGTPVDGRPGCTWEWARDTVGPWGGWYHACTAPGLVPAPAPSGDECDDVRPNPYTPEGAELAARCAKSGTPPAATPAIPMRVGARYEHPYSDLQMIVLAIVANTEGREIVLCEWVGESARQRPQPVFILADGDRGTWRVRNQ